MTDCWHPSIELLEPLLAKGDPDQRVRCAECGMEGRLVYPKWPRTSFDPLPIIVSEEVIRGDRHDRAQ